MPWKECHVVDERLRFIARWLDGEKMARLCAEFGISRKTGYKIRDRYKDCGVTALTDRSRRPYRHANQLPDLRRAGDRRAQEGYPAWGAPKIRERLRQRCPELQCPAISTVHAVLDRHGLVTRRGRRRPRLEGTALVPPGPAECALVCRLQGRVHARESAVLLPADHHRLREPVSDYLRRAVDDEGGVCLHRVRAGVQRLRAARAPFGRTTASVRVRACALRPEQVGGLVVTAGHCD